MPVVHSNQSVHGDGIPSGLRALTQQPTISIHRKE